MGDAPHVASLYDSQYDSSGFLQQQQHNQQQYYALLQQQQQQIQQQQQQHQSMPQYLQQQQVPAGASSGQTDTDGQQQQQQYHHQRRDSMESNSGSATGNGSSSAAKSAKDKDQNADKDSGPHKFSRSKGACQQCRAVKQRCSGASKHPCERCQLYKLECIFSKEPPPPKDPQKVPVKKPSVKQASIDPENGAAVVHSLRAITERLRSIEDQIAAQNRQIAQASLAVRDSSNASNASADSPLVTGFDTDVKRHHYNGSSAPGSSDGPISGLSVDSSVTEFADPVSTVSSAIKSIDDMLYSSTAQSAAKGGNGASPSSPYGTNSIVNGAASDRGSSPRNGSNSHGAVAKDQKDRKVTQPSSESDIPDAITRGFVTVEEAQQLFDFYFQRCAQWTPPLEFHNDRNMYHVRRRSTFLFHSILAVSSYFCYVPAGENGLRKYYAIVTTLVESLAPMIVSPNPAELTVDLLMGLLICILWKPVRCGSQMQLGPSGFSKLQAQSKINPSSGYVLGGLALRISQLLSLSRRAAALSPNDKDSVNACRLWMWINLVDSQSALAEGKQPALDPSDALRSTRLFASCKSKPGDVRLAALVELHAAVVPIVAMHHGAQKTDFRALYRANSVLDRLVVYWTPLIEDAYRTGDPLAATFLNIFVPFVRLVLNADVFRTWLIRQKRQSKNGEIDLENARHTLTSEEAHCIGFAVQAAEEMLYYLSTQSRIDGAARRHDWAPRDPATGHRPSLNLDQDLARLLASSVDSILLVVFAFPPLFLAQLRASNLVNCDLDMAPEITNDLYSVGFPSRSLLPASKFMRLMEVSAEFYEATAPNASFPSIQQASLLRSIACLSVPSDAPAPNNMPNGTLAPAVNGQQQGPGSFNMNQACAWNPTQASKVHQQYMQQIASQTAPTNPNLPYPYNHMVFSNEGADRLDNIMQAAVPDPTTSNSLLGSFAKIDADWNAYFSPAGLANNTANTYTFSDPGLQDLNNGSMPLNLYGAPPSYVQTPTGSVGVSPGATINTANLGGSKIPGQSPDSLSAFYQNTPSTYVQANSPIMPNTYSHMQQGNQSRLY